MQPNHNFRFTVPFFLGSDCQRFFVAMVVSHEAAEIEEVVMNDVQGLTMTQAVILVLFFYIIFFKIGADKGFETYC